MVKIDLKKELRHLYLPSAKKVTVVNVPEFSFVMVDGMIPAGLPPAESIEFQEALSALYGISYTLKFASKLRAEEPIDYTVMALEGLWWVNDGEFDISQSQDWQFRAMILQPDHITAEMVDDALEESRRKTENPALDKSRFQRFQEGLSIQIMHIGPYADEPRSLAKMSEYARENGYEYSGRHHEIYIGDPRRAKPENLKTVLRHPVRKLA
jgi:hypothetical protein